MKKVLFNRIYSILGTSALILAIIFATGRFNYLTVEKTEGTYYQFAAFEQQQENSIDVLFVGSSRVYCNINPSTLWSEYGMAAYDLASTAQRFHQAYYSIEQALLTQKPKLVVIEMSRPDHQGTEIEDVGETMSMFSGMGTTIYKLEELVKFTPRDKWGNYIFLPGSYHENFYGLKKDDYLGANFNQYPNTKIQGYKGAAEFLNVTGFKRFSEKQEINDEPFNDVMYEYLDKTRDLCEQNGIEMLFFNSPQIERDQYPAVEKYMQDNALTYLDYGDEPEKYGFDAGTDFADDVHLNFFGAEKLSKTLGEYIKKNYDIPDRRGQLGYESWDENLAYSNKRVKSMRLAYENGLGTYMKNFPDEDYILIVTLKGDYDKINQGQRSVLYRLGIDDVIYDKGGIFIYNGENLLAMASSEEEFKYIEDIENRTFEIINNEEKHNILIDNKEYALDIENGLEVVVYDKLSEKVVDSIMFDADEEYGAYRNK